MSDLVFHANHQGAHAGLKGPRAADWLVEQGIAVPAVPNCWVTVAGSDASAELLVARLGASEVFLEESQVGTTLRRIGRSLSAPEATPGVYPVLREDAAFVLAGDGALDVLAQVCNVNFGALDLQTRPVIMTQMIGVSVLVVPQPLTVAPQVGVLQPLSVPPQLGVEVRYRIWCDPTFGWYLDQAVGEIVIDGGGSHRGAT